MEHSQTTREADLQSRIYSRGQIKAQLTRFGTFISKIQPNTDDREEELINLQTRLDAIVPILKQFNVLQYEIETADQVTSSDNHELERSEFEERYYHLISIAKRMLNNHNQHNSNTHSPQVQLPEPNQSQSTIHAKLPKVALPEFSGAYDKWSNFKETFESLVNNNQSLSDLQRFYYLQSALKGEAAQIISSLSISNENYKYAWNLLTTRYQNKKALVHSHMKSIFELIEMPKENHAYLRKFTDSFLAHFRSLENLGENVNDWSTILIYLLNTKLSIQTRREWELFSKSKDSPTIQDFSQFLTDRCCLLESLDFKLNIKSPVHNVNMPTYPHRNNNFKPYTHIAKAIACPICDKEGHFVYACQNFLSLSTEQRFSEAKRLLLCTNCLRPGHSTQNCKSSRSCATCQRRHHSLLHISSNPKFSSHKQHSANNTQSVKQPPTGCSGLQEDHSGQSISFNKRDPDSQKYPDKTRLAREKESESAQWQGLPDSVPATYCVANERTFTLLPTANIYIYDSQNNPIPCRALLDSASQCNLVSNELFDRLNLPFDSINLPVSGLSQELIAINKRTTLNLGSMLCQYDTQASFYVIKNITGMMPQNPITMQKFTLPSNVQLADPNFGNPGKIDLLLGANLFFEILKPNQIKLGKKMPLLQDTHFGFVVAGDISMNVSAAQNCLLIKSLDIQEQLEKFWTVEESYTGKKMYSKEEAECEEHFVNTTKRDESGRFVIKLPMNENVNLGESYQIALKRFLAQEKKMMKDDNMRLEYTQFMAEYEALGHMSIIDPAAKSDSFTHFMPHHLIEKKDSSTTKYRVVFDGSCKTTSGNSLNTLLKVGPVVQNDLMNILVRFRKHPIILVGDLAKMYRQINLDPSERNLQCILWREDPTERIKTYSLNTLTYGTASASYIATRCLKQISIDVKHTSPKISQIILNDFYVDDLLTGCDSYEKMTQLRRDLVDIFKNYGFELRKFSSNHPSVLANISSDQRIPENYNITDNNTIKTLGVFFNIRKDIFQYNSNVISVPTHPHQVTKRAILAAISKIFDPLGLIGPLIIQAKIILQQLWSSKLEWDTPVSPEIYERWMEFYNQIDKIQNFQVPRQILINNPISIQILSFSDACSYAYGACIYARSVDSAGNIAVRLIAAKSRVAPLKTITLPNLELCGALLSARLTQKVVVSLQLKIDQHFYYTDSTIVLSWLSAEPTTWKTFVCNRISEIQSLTNPSDWYHVESAQNPADIISRGISPLELLNSHLWWHGPQYLQSNRQNWAHTHISKYSKISNIPEEKSKKQVTITTQQPLHPLTKLAESFSKFNKLVNVTAFCLRFINNSKPTKMKLKGLLSIEEITSSKRTLFKCIQRESFNNDIKMLESNKQLSTSSQLIKLNPFLDTQGILRVGGRLRHANIPYSHKHPIILPKNHHMTKLIIKQEHNNGLHPGAQTTLSLVRATYWPLGGKQMARKIVRQCVKCFKAAPKSINPQMGNLPPSRLEPCRPFIRCGVDYAGPFPLKDGKHRNRKIIKGYVCIFICMTTKAIHIELVTEMSTACFINALERLVSRRGCCTDIYSDNGTNFVGANNELTKISQIISTDMFNNFSTKNVIKWHFIPSHSPHFGGLWEAAVGSLKHHLRRILSNSPLTFEEFYTILTKVEAILNSRPLTPISDDPSDLEALTPGHFLIGDSITAMPEEDVQSATMSHLNRYQQLKFYTQHLWSRWKNDYLHHLQQRNKWHKNPEPGSLIGALVLLKDDCTPPLLWPLARIIQVHPGTDGIVRTVSVRTAKKTILKRALVKVCKLPINE